MKTSNFLFVVALLLGSRSLQAQTPPPTFCIVETMMKSGGRAGWSRYSLVMPGGSNQPFNYVTADAYDQWADIGSGDAAATIKKVHPGMTLAAYGKQIEEARQLVNQELWELIDSAR